MPEDQATSISRVIIAFAVALIAFVILLLSFPKLKTRWQQFISGLFKRLWMQRAIGVSLMVGGMLLLYRLAPKWAREAKSALEAFDKGEDLLSFLYILFHFIIGVGGALLFWIVCPLFMVLFGAAMVSQKWFAPRFMKFLEKIGKIWG